jgi:type I restriction enzyme R subunit
MNKKSMTEADIQRLCVTPAIVGTDQPKWDSATQVQEQHYFTKGRVVVQGKTTEYAEILDVPYAYRMNGDAFQEHDRTVSNGTVTREIAMGDFPTPEELWNRYCDAKGYAPKQRSVAAQSLILQLC